MGVETEKYIRKPLYVDAVRVTAGNFDDIAAWCQGEVQTEEVPGQGATKKFIKVRVHNPKNPRQTKAFVGDWLLYTERGYKVYTNKAFRAAFDLVEPKSELPAAPAVVEEAPAAQEEKLSLYRSREEGGLAEAETAVEDVVEIHETPQGEPHEYVEATPRAIADAIGGHEPIAESVEPESDTPQPEPVSEQEPEDAAAGKLVLSEDDQRELGPDQVRELISTGDAILAQDLRKSA